MKPVFGGKRNRKNWEITQIENDHNKPSVLQRGQCIGTWCRECTYMSSYKRVKKKPRVFVHFYMPHILAYEMCNRLNCGPTRWAFIFVFIFFWRSLADSGLDRIRPYSVNLNNIHHTLKLLKFVVYYRQVSFRKLKKTPKILLQYYFCASLDKLLGDFHVNRRCALNCLVRLPVLN